MRYLQATIDEQEQMMLGLAAGDVERETFRTWLAAHIREKENKQ